MSNNAVRKEGGEGWGTECNIPRRGNRGKRGIWDRALYPPERQSDSTLEIIGKRMNTSFQLKTTFLPTKGCSPCQVKIHVYAMCGSWFSKSFMRSLVLEFLCPRFLIYMLCRKFSPMHRTLMKWKYFRVVYFYAHLFTRNTSRVSLSM